MESASIVVRIPESEESAFLAITLGARLLLHPHMVCTRVERVPADSLWLDAWTRHRPGHLTLRAVYEATPDTLICPRGQMTLENSA